MRPSLRFSPIRRVHPLTARHPQPPAQPPAPALTNPTSPGGPIIRRQYSGPYSGLRGPYSRSSSSSSSRLRSLVHQIRLIRSSAPLPALTTLHCQWYVSKNPTRNEEIEFCVRRNLENESIDRFVWYVPEEDLDSVPEWLRGEVFPISGRLSYGTVLRNAAANKGSLHILINTDIIIPQSSIGSLRARMKIDTVVCLTRWESKISTFPEARIVKGSNSQDLWAWCSFPLSPSVQFPA